MASGGADLKPKPFPTPENGRPLGLLSAGHVRVTSGKLSGRVAHGCHDFRGLGVEADINQSLQKRLLGLKAGVKNLLVAHGSEGWLAVPGPESGEGPRWQVRWGWFFHSCACAP